MRLTFRTLLAYLDDVLDPADAAELKHKIDDSPFASQIVKRIKGAIRRGQLPAPKLDGKGIGFDANSVAEYLDNVLPEEKLQEFEKVCVDSDMHLAEAAACHQILTLVLGHKADIDPAMRQRMYRIGAPLMPPPSVDDVLPPPVMEPVIVAAPGAPPLPPPPEAPPTPAAPAPVAISAAPAPAPAADHPVHKKPEVPDYLREESSPRWWPVLVVLALSVILGVSLLAATGPLNWNHPIVALLGFKSGEPAPNGDPAHGPPDKPGPVVPPVTPPGPKGPTDTKPMTPMVTPMPEMPPVTPPVEPMPMPMPMATPKGPPETEPVRPMPPPVGPMPVPMPAPMPPPPAVPMVNPGVPVPVPVEPMPPVVADVARYTSDAEVLLRMPADNSGWVRLAPRAAVQSGDRLHAPPTLRPQLLLVGSIQTTLVGATSVVARTADARGLPRLDLEYGRLVLAMVGMPGGQCTVDTAGREFTLAFTDADSACAVELRRFHDPGSDPVAAPAHRAVTIVVTAGSVTITEKGQRPQAVGAAHTLVAFDNEPAKMQPAESLPEWIAGKELTDIDHRAATALREELDKRPPTQVTLVLRELCDDRRAEMRSLAVRALGYLGEFEPYVEALNDQNQRSSWGEQFEALEVCLALGPEYAGRIREGFEKKARDEAPILYRLLWGYSAEDLRNEGSKKLVEYLDHQSMAVRVLAFENLRRISGLTLLYRPQDNAARRKSAIQKWKERANAPGGITYAKPMAPRVTDPAESPDPAPVAPLPTVPAPLPTVPAPLPGGTSPVPPAPVPPGILPPAPGAVPVPRI